MFREFLKEDYVGFAGAEELPNGKKPLIAEKDLLPDGIGCVYCVISGVSFEDNIQVGMTVMNSGYETSVFMKEFSANTDINNIVKDMEAILAKLTYHNKNEILVEGGFDKIM